MVYVFGQSILFYWSPFTDEKFRTLQSQLINLKFLERFAKMRRMTSTLAKSFVFELCVDTMEGIVEPD